MAEPIHFYLTFNPYLNESMEPGHTQAHEFYEYLVKNIKKKEKPYAYWGKIINANRESKVDFEKLEQIQKHNSDLGVSTHLYITDFKNLWVGKVDSVHSDIDENDDFQTLEFYKGKKVEVWFKISDFTLIDHGPESTARALSQFYIDNDFMNLKIHALSPFTTAIRYPTFIQDKKGELYFDQLDDSEGPLALKYNPAIDSTTLDTILRSLYSHAIPENLYKLIPHSARTEIEGAEIDMLEKRQHNVSKIAFSYIKAMEIILNDLIIHHIKRCGYGDQFFVAYETMPPKLYFEKNRPGLIPISKFQKNYSCTQLFYFVQRGMQAKNFCFKKAFHGKEDFIKFVSQDLPRLLEKNQILNMRGVLAHADSDNVSVSDCIAVRNLILGVGCKGIIHAIYQSFYPDEFKSMIRVTGDYNNKYNKKKGHHTKKKSA